MVQNISTRVKITQGGCTCHSRPVEMVTTSCCPVCCDAQEELSLSLSIMNINSCCCVDLLHCLLYSLNSEIHFYVSFHSCRRLQCFLIHCCELLLSQMYLRSWFLIYFENYYQYNYRRHSHRHFCEIMQCTEDCWLV